MRTGLLDVIQADYIRTARAKGLEERVVIGKHAFRNGLLPILTLLAGLLPAILGGSVIVEYIFGIPGMGLWVVESINARDYNAIMAIQLVSTLLVLFGILLTDLSYAVVDPRIRYR
jgi:peptide/nickel transport system permease protein